MIPTKITVIPIHPVTNVRTTQDEAWLLKVTEEYLLAYEEKRRQRDIEEGKEPRNRRNISRKRQLEKYSAYKQELGWWKVQNKFEPPLAHFAIWFYVPHPKSWRKKEIAEKLYKPHETTPDCDNFLKAYLDGFFPRLPRQNRLKKDKVSDDRKIHCYTAFKVWVTFEEACIKILEYAEPDFMKEFEHGHPLFWKT